MININFIFQIISLFIIIGFIAKYIYKSLIQNINIKMEQEILFETNLNKEKELFVNSQVDIKLDIKKQEVLYENLSKKVVKWQAVSQEKYEKSLQEEENIRIKLKEKLKIQADQQAIERLEADIAPLIKKSLADYSESYFRKESHQKDYIHGIINYIDKY